MQIDIDKLNYAELIDLNHRVVERLKFLDQMQAHAQMLEFSIGDKVEFISRDGSPVVGIITKYNRKTVAIVSEQGQRWRVAPQFLRKITATASAADNVVSITSRQE